MCGSDLGCVDHGERPGTRSLYLYSDSPRAHMNPLPRSQLAVAHHEADESYLVRENCDL